LESTREGLSLGMAVNWFILKDEEVKKKAKSRSDFVQDAPASLFS